LSLNYITKNFLTKNKGPVLKTSPLCLTLFQSGHLSKSLQRITIPITTIQTMAKKVNHPIIARLNFLSSELTSSKHLANKYDTTPIDIKPALKKIIRLIIIFTPSFI
jgi:hypothetical protein